MYHFTIFINILQNCFITIVKYANTRPYEPPSQSQINTILPFMQHSMYVYAYISIYDFLPYLHTYVQYIYFCFQEWIKEDNRFQKSRAYVYNQKPETSNSTALIERLKNLILCSLLYIFE